MKIKMISKKDKNNLVAKSNRFIEAYYPKRLKLQEIRLFLLVVSKINPQKDKGFNSYRISVKEFAELLGINNKNIYGILSNMMEDLRKRDVFIKRSSNSILKANLFASCEYFEGEGYVEVEISPKLESELLKLKEFTQYYLMYILQLNSFYHIRIYEILKRHYEAQKKYKKVAQKEILIEDFRKMLGIQKDKYSYFGHLKSRILEPAKKELEAKTDICFTYREIKTGRKVTAIEFTIYQNTSQDIKRLSIKSSESEVKENPEIVTLMIKYIGLQEPTALDIWEKQWNFVEAGYRKEAMSSYREFKDYLQDKINLALIEEKNNRIRDTKQGFFICAVQRNYDTSRLKKIKEAEEKKKKAKAREKIKIEIDRLENIKLKLERKIQVEKEEIINLIIQEYPERIKQIIIEWKENIERNNDFLRVHIARKWKHDLTLIENYRAIPTIWDGVNSEIEKIFPERFEEINARYEKPASEIDARILSLK